MSTPPGGAVRGRRGRRGAAARGPRPALPLSRIPRRCSRGGGPRRRRGRVRRRRRRQRVRQVHAGAPAGRAGQARRGDDSRRLRARPADRRRPPGRPARGRRALPDTPTTSSSRSAWRTTWRSASRTWPGRRRRSGDGSTKCWTGSGSTELRLREPHLLSGGQKQRHGPCGSPRRAAPRPGARRAHGDAGPGGPCGGARRRPRPARGGARCRVRHAGDGRGRGRRPGDCARTWIGRVRRRRARGCSARPSWSVGSASGCRRPAIWRWSWPPADECSRRCRCTMAELTAALGGTG